MKLIDYCRSVDFVDFDSYDNVYDVIVTICFDEETVDKPEDSFDRFVKYIVEHVDYIKGNGNYVICDWNGFVKAHEQVLRQYEHDCWRYNYDDDEDEFVYEWIREINLYLAGYISEAGYTDIVNRLEAENN